MNPSRWHAKLTVPLSIVTALCLLSLAGCSMFGSPEQPQRKSTVAARNARRAIANDTSSVSISGLQGEAAPSQRIELLWAVPREPVEGFVIYYGAARDRLDKEVRVLSSALDQIQDPDKGSAYRFMISETASDKPLFVALRAFNGNNTSPLSEVVEVKP